MAPRRGGGGGGSGGGSSSSSSSCDSTDYPCTTQLHYIYGDRIASQFSESEVYGQLVVYIIWSITLIILFTQTLKPKARWLQLAILSYLASFIFLSVRFGLIVSESDVPIGYRFESSVVVLLQRLGMVFLIAAVFPADEARKFMKIIFYPALAILAILNITYLILDFLISAKALDQFKDDWVWRLSDRDFGLTNTPHALYELTMNSGSWGATALSPFYVERRMYDVLAEDGWEKQRSIQIKIGLAADFVALALALFLAIVAGLAGFSRKKTSTLGSRGTIYLLLAAFGLLLTALFRVIIAAHYILWNWNIATDPGRWLEWTSTFNFNDNYIIEGGGGGFLEGYRTTVAGFPVVQAVIEPLGIVLAILGMVLWWRARCRTREVV